MLLLIYTYYTHALEYYDIGMEQMLSASNVNTTMIGMNWPNKTISIKIRVLIILLTWSYNLIWLICILYTSFNKYTILK